MVANSTDVSMGDRLTNLLISWMDYLPHRLLEGLIVP